MELIVSLKRCAVIGQNSKESVKQKLLCVVLKFALHSV